MKKDPKMDVFRRAGIPDSPYVLFLQTGTCAQSQKSKGSAALFCWGSKSFLIDTGTGTLDGLYETNRRVQEIQGVFLTHHHPDHAGELSAFMQTLVFGAEERRREDFFVVGGPKTKELMGVFSKYFGDWILGRDFHVKVKEIEGESEFCLKKAKETSSVGGIFIEEDGVVEKKAKEEGKKRTSPQVSKMKVRALSVDHSPSSLAYRWDFGQKSLVFTGDMGSFDEPFLRFAQGVDTLVVECSFPDEKAISGHLTPSLVARLACEVRAKRTIITHLYPFHSPKQAIAAVKKGYAGPVEAAFPGFVCTL